MDPSAGPTTKQTLIARVTVCELRPPHTHARTQVTRHQCAECIDRLKTLAISTIFLLSTQRLPHCGSHVVCTRAGAGWYAYQGKRRVPRPYDHRHGLQQEGLGGLPHVDAIVAAVVRIRTQSITICVASPRRRRGPVLRHAPGRGAIVAANSTARPPLLVVRLVVPMLNQSTMGPGRSGGRASEKLSRAGHG